MIYVFSEEFGDKCNRDYLIDNADAIENLINSYTNRNNIIVPQYELLDSLLNNYDLFSRRQLGALKDIKDNYHILNGIAKDADATVLIVPDGLPLTSERQNQLFKAHIGHFEIAEASAPSRLLVEDRLNDGAFF
jgi:hypothetical protein